ncbi:phage tail spike protein, partial [Clostridium perfringens]
MLKLKDKNKKLVAGLINYKDLCIESILATGDKKLSFSLPKEDKFYNFIEEEGYIETKTQEYVIKAKDVGVDYTRFDCVLNLETLEANIFDRFESVEQTITSSLNLAIVGTGWTVKDNTLKKKRTVRCTNKNALEIVQEIKKTYRVDIVFNTLKREIEVYEHLGEDKGTYFIDSLNLTALQVQSDSYKFATRIIAEGKDGLTFSSINNGKNYVENFQYSKKIKTIYWKDERYTIKESLLEDAKAKLEEISKPYTSYNASILNLAELNPKYILDYRLGDTITLISKNNKVKDKQRIVKTIEYPQDHSRDTVELANAVLKFEDIQQENQETTSTVNNITVDDGTIDGSTIDGIKVKQIEDFKANVVEAVNLKAINANIDNLHANKADIQDLHAVTAKIGTLEATKADITQLNAVNADISNLNAIKANIVDLNSATAKIGVLESKTASIDNLLAGNLTANNFKANSITANSGIIAEGAIGSGQISSLTANKINAGTIDLSLVTVAGPNGRLRLQGNKLQIMDNKDGKLYERIMLGVDSNNNSSLVLRGADGKTILLNQDGLTKAGITEGFNKIDDNSIDASLIFDKNSMVRNINGATETIKGTRIQVGDRTLDVELSTQKNTITEHGEELSSQKATIQALDNAIKLKVDEQVYRDSINTINNNISTTNSNLSKATTELKLLKGKVDLKVNKIDIDKTVKEIEDKIKVTTDKITTVESKLTQENNSIKASVQDLNSTTQTITTNISNISKDLTSKINSNLDAAKSFATDIAIAKATIAKEDAINVASLDATSKSSNALNAAKNYIDLEVKTINTKVHNLESGIDILKDQIKSKVSQSDIDKSITTVDDKIKILNSNISDVSSSVTQLRDSVTTQINSINSKTHSIETTLGVKASKEEVTEVNNKVTEVTASLNGITQRVGNTESRINALDGKVAGAVTLQQFTEFKQSNRDFQLKVAQTTNLHNLVPNGTFAGGLREWMCGGEFWSGTYTGYGFSGKICGAVKNKSTSEKFLTSYKAFKVEKNTTYTLNFHYKVEQNVQSMEAFVMLSNTEYGDYGQIIKVMEALGGERSDLTNDIPHTFTFNTGNFEWLWLRFDNNGMKPNTNLDEYCWLYISEVAVYKGNVGAVKYLPKGGETYDTTFKLDGMGYNCKFASGAWNQIGAEGNMWYAPGMQYPYRSLSYHEAVSINTDGSNNYI